MNPVKHLGVDVSKAYLDIDEQAERVANQPEAIRAWMETLPADTHLVCESSGGYERALLEAAWSRRRPISVVMPTRVRAFARSRGQHAKTDRLDCALLSVFGRELNPPVTPRPDAVRETVRALLRAREHVLGLQLLERNHREHLRELPVLQEQSDARLALLAAQIKQLDTQIKAAIAADAQASAKVARLRQLKSVGPITAWTAWADLPELGELQPGQAASLCGLAPHPDQSGTREGPRHIQHGRATLRRVLYMAAVSASVHNPILRAIYTDLRARGKPAKVALIALARRIVELLNLLLQNPKFLLAR